MPTRPNHRKLSEHLAVLSAPQLAVLLQRRPDLVRPRPPLDVADLAQRAQHEPSIVRAIAALTLPQHRLLQLVVCCRPSVPISELAPALPDDVGLDDIAPVLATLEEFALVWRFGDRVHSSGSLRNVMPTTLGPPLQVLVSGQSVDYVRHAVRLLRLEAAGANLEGLLPLPAAGPGGRPPRKAELVEELESLLCISGVVDAVLASAPEDCAELARDLSTGRPGLRLGHSLYYSRYGSNYGGDSPAKWLYERALLVPGREGEIVYQPREVGTALRGGRPVSDLALDCPPLRVGAAPAGRATVDELAAAQAMQTLERLADLCDRWAHAPVKSLQSGGLGVSALKQTAAMFDADLDDATRIVELANLAGLVETTTTSSRRNRKFVHESFITASSAAPVWVALPIEQRWSQLATAWLRAMCWPSASGRKRADGKAIPVLSAQRAETAPVRRREVLDALASVAPGEATDVAAVRAHVYWCRPQSWLGFGTEDPRDAIGWVYAEAEALGMLAGGALSSFGRALLAGDRQTAERAIEAALPVAATTFTLQADLTATVVGAIDRDVANELRLLADVESSGAATTWRFSDATIRRAIDAGRDGDAILEFLTSHTPRGVPQGLAYLVKDVARRHGHLKVGTASCFVTSDDPAVLADACSHRRLRKLGLVLLAPTVAVSAHPAAKVLDGLRDAGFLPAGVDESKGTIAVESPAPDRAGSRHRPRAEGTLPERFAARGPIRNDAMPGLDDATAQSIAGAILAGRTIDGRPLRVAATPSFFDDTDDDFDDMNDDFDEFDGFLTIALTDDDDPRDSLDTLIENAFNNSRVVAISLGDPEESDPLLLAITAWEPGQFAGIDLSDGSTVSILPEHVTAAVDLGPVGQLTSLAARRSRPAPHRGSRSRRRR